MREMCISCDNWAKHDFKPSIRRAGDGAPAEVYSSETQIPPSVKMSHPWKSLPFSRVVVWELGRFVYLAWTASETFGGEQQTSAQPGKGTGTHGRTSG